MLFRSCTSLGKLTREVQLDDGPAQLEAFEDGGGEGLNHWYRVVIKEGRNREVRRIFEAVGVPVSRLMRVRYGPIKLDGWLKRGMVRELADAEVSALLAAAGMGPPPAPVAAAPAGKPAPWMRLPSQRPVRKRK